MTGVEEFRPHHFDDTAMETAMGHLLRFGVVLASIVVFVGGVLYLVQHHERAVNYSRFLGEPLALHILPQTLRLALGGDGAAIIAIGILLLVATPIARVVFAIVAFLLERDWLYTAVSMIVLAVLSWGLIYGR